MRHDLLDRGKQLKKIKNRQGIQYILDEVSGILGNPILMYDMEYKLIAYAGNPVMDDPIWYEFFATGTIGHERIEFFKEESFLESAANAKKTIFLISEKLKYDRIVGKIYTKYSIQVGSATILGCNKPFTNDDPELFDTVCEILSRELSNIEFYQSYGQIQRELLVSKLIEGSINDRAIYVAQVADIYHGLGANLHLVVADIAQSDKDHTELAYFRDLFKRKEPAFKYSIYSNYIIIVISTDNAAFDVKKDLKKLRKIFTKYNIYAGIRSDTDNLFELYKYYNDALNALHYGMITEGDQRIFVFSETI